MISVFIIHLAAIMPPVKLCPQCGSMVMIKKSMCECGHSFILKKKKSPDLNYNATRRIATQQKRALESSDQSLLRHINDSTRKAQKRAIETEEESVQRKIANSAYQSNKRAMETMQ